MPYDALLKVKEVGLKGDKISKVFPTGDGLLPFRVDVTNLGAGSTVKVIVEESKDGITFVEHKSTKVFSTNERKHCLEMQPINFYRFNIKVVGSADVEINVGM